MIIHITPGEKFERYAAEQFEAVLPGGNRFVTVLPEGGSEAAGSGGFERERVFVGTDGYERLLADISRSECAVFHSFPPHFLQLREHCPPSCLTAWVAWGYESCSLAPYRLDVLQPLTSGLLIDAAVRRRGWLRLLRRALGPLFPGRLLVRLAGWRGRLFQRRYVKALRSFDYVLTNIKEEVELFRRLGLSEAAHLRFFYRSIEKMVGRRVLDERCAGKDILLGNSASLTSNHLDAIEILARLDLAGRRVVCPLSYGDPDYARAVVEAGRRRLGGTFTPLLELMPLDEYNRLMAGCAVLVMNHLRQQGMGNIITALWLGAKVYLNETTTVWRYLRRIGLKAYSIPAELRPGNPEALKAPPEEIVERNREVLRREFSHERVLGYCRGVVEELARRAGRRGGAREGPG